MEGRSSQDVLAALASPTFGKDGSFEVNKPVGSMSISPCGRDVVLASRQGLHVVDLDSPWAPPRHLPHHTPWEVADVQWSPFPSRAHWVVSTSNQKALVWNLAMVDRQASVEHYLHAHSRAITDINFSAHHADMLATCAVDSFVHCWDLRYPAQPAFSFCDWYAGATQVKWNRQDSHVIASSHDKFLRIWDDRNGARPLRSIEAHATKIYGIDWNRVREHALLTCSLDHTIKLWDYGKGGDIPECTIHTPFPIWRARHTPFGRGILAMPQRGDNNLYLYDRHGDCQQSDNCYTSVKAFEGHRDQVKEFLWRTRGSVDDGIDNREFQLVSWGADRFLRLHALSSETLAAVGYEKGKEIDKKLNLTRKNAPYKTFREKAVQLEEHKQGNSHLRKDGITLQSRSSVLEGWAGGFLTSQSTSHVRADANRDMDPITWMKGVKIGKKEAPLEESTASLNTHDVRAGRDWEEFESLGEEIAYVGTKFSKVEFLEIDVKNRFVQVAMRGLWDSKESSTYLKCRIDFPKLYPSEAAPELTVEKTPSLNNNLLEKLQMDVVIIGTAYVDIGKGSLEALLRYLQGDQTVDEAIAWTKEEQDQSIAEIRNEDDSSSDEEDEVAQFDETEFGLSGSGVLNMADPNANMPLPGTCGALWAKDGRLVCFFQPKEEKQISLANALRLSERDGMARGRKRIFEGFGKVERNHASTSMISSLGTWNSTESASDFDGSDSERSSSDSSASSKDFNPKGLRLASNVFETEGFGLHFLQTDKVGDQTQRSAPSVGVPQVSTKMATTISIHNLELLLPSKAQLAQGYLHSGFKACKENAKVASNCGQDNLASVWLLLCLLLDEVVPLKPYHLEVDSGSLIAYSAPRKPQRKKLRSLSKRDSNLGNRNTLGQVKWAYHPFGARLLVKNLYVIGFIVVRLRSCANILRFHYFSEMADVQMLALMACVLSFGANYRQAATQTDARVDAGNLSMATDRKQTSVAGYFPSPTVASSILGVSKVRSSNSNDPSKLPRNPPTFSSSSGGAAAQIGPTDSTGPETASDFKTIKWNLDNADGGNLLSGSPEMIRPINKSTTNLASAFAATFPRPFSFSASTSSSPPAAPFPTKRISPIGSLAILHDRNDLAESSLYKQPQASRLVTSSPRDISAIDFGALGSQKKGAARGSRRPQSAKIRLRNQDQFQIDGYSHSPLLDPEDASTYQSHREVYAEMLSYWQRPIERAEVLKHNDWAVGKSIGNGRFVAKEGTDTLSIGKKASAEHPATAKRGKMLDVSVHCRTCDLAQRPTPGHVRTSCPRCGTSTDSVYCVLCDTTILQTLSSPCLKCGHVMCTDCREDWLRVAVSQDEMCVTGCECSCIVSDSPVVQWYDSGKGDPQSSGTRAATDKRGTRPKRIDLDMKWKDVEEDLAYESLAKNLGASRKPSRASIRPSKSQVWRGRERRGASMGTVEEGRDRNIWLGI